METEARREFGVTGLRRGGLPGGLSVELHAWLRCPKPPLSPFAQMLSRRWLWGWGGRRVEGSCGGGRVPASLGACVSVRPHCPLPAVLPWSTPSACTCGTLGCGPRVGTRSPGGISFGKRCFPECPNLALSSPEKAFPPPPQETSTPLRFEPSVDIGPEMPSPFSPPSPDDREPAVR